MKTHRNYNCINTTSTIEYPHRYSVGLHRGSKIQLASGNLVREMIRVYLEQNKSPDKPIHLSVVSI